MFIALSRFTIANGMTHEVRAAFQQRPHLVDDASGFAGMEVMSPVGNPAEIWLLTRWRDEQCYRDWHRGHNRFNRLANMVGADSWSADAAAAVVYANQRSAA